MALHEDSSGAERPVREPDSHGHAALLLAESMLHMLVERSVLTVADAVEVVQTAAEAKMQVAIHTGETQAGMQSSMDLLFRISDSFAVDLPRDTSD